MMKSTSRWCSDTTDSSLTESIYIGAFREILSDYVAFDLQSDRVLVFDYLYRGQIQKTGEAMRGNKWQTDGWGAFSPSLTQLGRAFLSPCQQGQELRGGCELRLKQQTVRAT